MDSGPGRLREASDEEILKAFRSKDDPILTASDVAEYLSVVDVVT